MVKKKILMIDDEKDSCHFVKLSLERSGKYQVHTVSSGTDGIAAVQLNPDLILLDVILHDMVGGEVASKLMSDSRTQDIPVNFSTAMFQTREADQLRGRHQFLAKSITPEALMKKMDARLAFL